jgi:tRNA threonylcarbamoyladenosine biosynthesis protein TsaE
MEANLQTITLLSKGPEDTLSLGSHIGGTLTAGLVIALKGDLGSGKTVLVQGLAKGLAVPSAYYITSPSYTLINEYPGKFSLFHIDLYRLEALDDIDSLGVFDLFDDMNVVAIEWAERLQDELPSDYLSIRFETIDDTHRKICITPYGLQASNVVMSLQRHNFIEFFDA